LRAGMLVLLAVGTVSLSSAPASSAVAAMTAPVPGTMAVEQYPTGSCSAVGDVALISATSGCLTALRQQHPGAVLLAYVKGEICIGRASCPADTASPEYAHNNLGSRIRGSGRGTFLMQPDNPAWMATVAANCRSYLSAGWDGCLLDMMGPASFALVKPHRSITGIAVPGSQPPAIYTGTEWATLASNLYRFVQANVASTAHLTANGLAAPLCVVAPGCVAAGSRYPTNGLIADNSSGTYDGAELEAFPCQEIGLTPPPCITDAEVAAWHATATQYAPAEQLQIIDHQGYAPVDHETALALFLLADQDPAHTWWAYCTSSATDSACQQPDAEYTSFFTNVLSAGGYLWLGADSANPSLYHSTWTQGDCFVNTGADLQLAIPGTGGQPAYELNGTVDTAGASYTLPAGHGMCWRAVGP
jgi:hypothetical protein